MSHEQNVQDAAYVLEDEDALNCDLLEQTTREKPGKPRGVALGFFDGVHHGHQELLNALLHHCRQSDFEPTVFSFYRLPQKESFETAERQYRGLIQVPKKRAEYLRSYGINQIWMQEFNDRFMDLTPESFLTDILFRRLGIRLVVIGQNFRYGKNREGDADFLLDWGKRNDVEVVVVPDVLMSKETISSSRIKRSIIKGDFREVSRFLGHDFSMSGPVIRGNALGRTVGMPTANVAVPDGQLCPPYGVYVTRTRVGDRIYPSVSNVGTRPTVNKSDFVPLLETCLLDVDIDLYNQEIEVFFLDFVRPELNFSSFLSMTAAISEDITYANEWHRSHEELVLASEKNGIPVYTLAASRFNSSIINIVFRDRLEPRQSAANALAARILMTATNTFPTRASLQLAADNLYGASIGSHVVRQGDLQAISFHADGIRHAIDGSWPFADIVNILIDSLQSPLLDESGIMDSELFKTEQRNMIAEIKARRQDKAWFALDRSLNLWTDGFPQAIPASGEIDEIATLTPIDVTNAWHRLLREAEIHVFIGGDPNQQILDQVIKFTDTLPNTTKRLKFIPGVEPTQTDLPRLEAVTEYRDLEQSRLVMIYKGLPPYHYHQYAITAVVNNLLGGDVNSLLFNEVREERALAYHISSMTIRFLNCLVVQAGIKSKDADDVTALVRACVSKIREQKIDSKQFETAKGLLRSELLSIRDNLSAMLAFQMNNLTAGTRVNVDEAIHELDEVSLRQVSEAATSLAEAFTYKLLSSQSVDHVNETRLNTKATADLETEDVALPLVTHGTDYRVGLGADYRIGRGEAFRNALEEADGE